MTKKHTFETWLALGAWLFVSIGCAPKTGGGSNKAADQTNDVLLVEQISSQSPDQCRLKVTLNQPLSNVDAHVSLTAEAGITFLPGNMQSSEQITMTLKAGEIRAHTFNCQLDRANVRLPGEYVVQATAVDRIEGAVLYSAETRLPISREGGSAPRFSPSQESFDKQFSDGFVPGAGNIQYRVDLADMPYPTEGTLSFKVVSDEAGGEFALRVSVVDSIEFDDPADTTTIGLIEGSGQHSFQAVFGPIAEHGSRIIRVPFHLGDDSMDGTYRLDVIEDNGTAAWLETAPVLFKVESDETVSDTQWLASDKLAQVEPTRQAGRLGVNVAAFQPTPTATPTELPAAPEATAVPTPAATPTRDGAVIQAMYVAWDQPLTAYYGSCQDMYTQRIEGKLPMSWEIFRAAAVYYNPDLANTDCMFDPLKTYWLPAVATIEASN
jgi:hypothetical protein